MIDVEREREATQAAYEKMVAHFSAPGAVFGFDPKFQIDYSNTEGVCVYRGGKDPKSPVRCAFGCLIPNEIYKPEWENKTVDTLFDETPAGEEFWGDLVHVSYQFLVDAQKLHDVMAVSAMRDGNSDSTVQGFVAELHELARKHGLTTTTKEQ